MWPSIRGRKLDRIAWGTDFVRQSAGCALVGVFVVQRGPSLNGDGRTHAAFGGIAPGQLLDVFATDAAAPVDFEAFCRETGHSLVNIEQVGEIYQIRLRKAED